ncbi:MAG TPA: hypothetical protein VF711_08145, partial [Acidimicrobiales bacterium]
MTEDPELLDRLAKALRPGAVEPPPARVHAVRRLVTRPHPVLRSISGGSESPGHGLAAPERRLRWGWADRRVTMACSAVAAVALLLIAGVAALQILPGSSAPSRSSALLRAQNAAYRVQVAIDRRDPAQVAKADADLLRTAKEISDTDRREIQRIAVPVHVQAIAFLRDHASPDVLSDMPGAISAGEVPPPPVPDVAVSAPVSVPPVTVPDGAPKLVEPAVTPPGVDGSATTLGAPVTPSVTINRVEPRLDGDFDVIFTVA